MRFSKNSESQSTEFVENCEEVFLRSDLLTDVFNRFKTSTHSGVTVAKGLTKFTNAF